MVEERERGTCILLPICYSASLFDDVTRRMSEWVVVGKELVTCTRFFVLKSVLRAPEWGFYGAQGLWVCASPLHSGMTL